MKTIKDELLYKYSDVIKVKNNELKEIKEEFNDIFKKMKSNMRINKSFQVILNNSNEDIIISDFFLFPTHKLFYSNDLEKKDFGLRICAIKKVKNKKKQYKQFLFDINSHTLEKEDWLSYGYLGKGVKLNDTFKDQFNAYMKVLNKFTKKRLKGKSHIVYSTNTGWVQGGQRWYYIPIIPDNKTDLIYDKNLKSRYKIKTDTTQTLQSVFKTTLNMIDVTEKRITIPLLSYTFLSLVTSLLNYKESNLSKFLICISGDNKTIGRAGFANSFCNLFNRKQNIVSVNSDFHSNLNCSEEELRNKSSKIRDGIFIINAEGNPRKISIARKLLQNNILENMMLVLSEEEIYQDSVLNLNINNIHIDPSSSQYLKKEHISLSTCITYFIYYQRERWNTASGKQEIRKSLVKFYKNYRKFFESDNIDYDINKVHMYSCLLVGYALFLNFGKHIGAIDNKLKIKYFKEATKIFRESSTIHSSDTKIQNETIKEEIHIVFLKNLLTLLQVNKPINFADKNNLLVDNKNTIGWIENENIFYIKTNVFEKIENLLNTNNKNIRLKKRKKEIYTELYKSGVILNPIDKKIDKVQVTNIEKVLNVTSGSKTTTTRVFKMDKAKALSYLDETMTSK